MSKKDTALKYLLARGIGESLAQKVISKGFSVSKIRTNKKEIKELFSEEDAEELISKCERQPIPADTVEKLLIESHCACCFCCDVKLEDPIVFHHIEEYAKTQDNSYDNLVVLCLNHHAKVHTKPLLDRSKYLPEVIRTRKTEWIEEIKRAKKGLRPWPGHEKIIDPNSLHHFKKIDSPRLGSFFPSTNLFSKNLAFFTTAEQGLINNLCTILTNKKTERLALLTGPPAYGKTVIGLSIAKGLQSKGYSVFYLSLNPSIGIDAIWNEFKKCDAFNTLLIVDNCHLNIDVASQIYRFFDEISEASCLLISRDIAEAYRKCYDFDNLDIFKELSERERSFNLGSVLKSKFDEKIIGIAKKYKTHFENENKSILELGDINKIVVNSHNNLLTLNAALSFWSTQQPLDRLGQAKILSQIYDRYLAPLTPQQQDVFLNFSALFQYEIKAEAIPEEIGTVREIAKEGIIRHDPETDYYTLHHSGFAELILKAFASRPAFKRQFRSYKDFILNQITSYISGFHNYPSNIDELFQNLFGNKARHIFIPLMRHEDIRHKIVNYYKDSKSIEATTNFVFKATNYMPAPLVKFYTQNIILQNNQIKRLLSDSDKPLLYYVKLFKTLHRADRNDSYLFARKFSQKDITTIIANCNFYIICYSIHSLHEADKKGARNLFSLIPAHELASKARKANLFEVLGGLKHLRWIDTTKAIKVFRDYATIDESEFSKRQTGFRFEELAEAFNGLNRLDSSTNLKLFKKIPSSTWEALIMRASFAMVGYGLSRIKDFNMEGARTLLQLININDFVGEYQVKKISHVGNVLAEFYKIDPKFAITAFQRMDNKKLAEGFEFAPFVHCGKSLSELSKVHFSKTKTLYNSLDFNVLFSKAQRSDLKKLSKALSELSKIDRSLTKKIFNNISVPALLGMVHQTPLEGIGRSLRELKNVDPKKAGQLFSQVDIQYIAKQFKDISLVQIGHTLAELNAADHDRTKEIYHLIPDQILQKKLRAEDIKFQKLGSLVSQLRAVEHEGAKTKFLLNTYNMSDWGRCAREARFGELGAGLKDLNIFDSKLAEEILNNLSLDHLKERCREENFEKFGTSIRTINSISPELAATLLDSFTISEISDKASLITLQKFANSLSNIAQFNNDYAKKILQSIGFDTLVSKSKKANWGILKESLSKLEKIDYHFTNKIKRTIKTKPNYQKHRRKKVQPSH